VHIFSPRLKVHIFSTRSKVYIFLCVQNWALLYWARRANPAPVRLHSPRLHPHTATPAARDPNLGSGNHDRRRGGEGGGGVRSESREPRVEGGATRSLAIRSCPMQFDFWLNPCSLSQSRSSGSGNFASHNPVKPITQYAMRNDPCSFFSAHNGSSSALSRLASSAPPHIEAAHIAAQRSEICHRERSANIHIHPLPASPPQHASPRDTRD
jgi:hypothetical protein